MSPSVEFYVPSGKTPDELEACVKEGQGRIKKIKVWSSEITPSIMAFSVASERHFSKVGQELSYDDYFSTLNKFPKKVKTDILKDFFTENVTGGIDNPGAYAEELDRVTNIDYMEPVDCIVPVPELREYVHAHLDSLGFLGMPVFLDNPNLTDGKEKPSESYEMSSSWHKIRCKLSDKLESVTRPEIKDIARAGVFAKTRIDGVPLGASQVILMDVVNHVMWEASSQKMSNRGHKSNPFEPLVRIYEKGYLPMGVFEDKEGNPHFSISVPEK